MPLFNFNSKQTASFSEKKKKEIADTFLKFEQEGFFQRIIEQQYEKISMLKRLEFPITQTKPAEAKILTVIFAGGQGSRLNKGTKALLQLSNGKRLLEHLIDKVKGEVVVMCSEENIGLIKKIPLRRSVHLFVQSSYPAFALSHQPIFVNEDLLWLPSGNGEALFDLARKGFFDLEFDHMSLCNVDNPLWEPEDPTFIYQHLVQKNEVTIASCLIPKGKKMGVICERSPYIIEYGEKNTGGVFGNMGAYLVSRSFCEKVISKPLPNLYPIKKKLNPREEGYKLESFFFDAFHYAKRVGICRFDGEKSFFPIKEKEDLTAFFCYKSSKMLQ